MRVGAKLAAAAARPSLRHRLHRFRRRNAKRLRLLRRMVRAVPRDVHNRLRYGRDAPLRDQRVWVDPNAIDSCLVVALGRAVSGQVRDGDWDLARRPLAELPKHRFCVQHWRDGVPWEDTGAYQHVLERIRERGRPFDGCSDQRDVVKRFRRLDKLYHRICREGRLAPIREVRRYAFREEKGVFVHIDRDGAPVFDGGGIHRLMIARVLELDHIPAQVGVVHRDALEVFAARYHPGAKAPPR